MDLKFKFTILNIHILYFQNCVTKNFTYGKDFVGLVVFVLLYKKDFRLGKQIHV